jgi:hypothetical protein
MRLGEFLIMRGLVTKTEVDQAFRDQLVNNHMLGVLAVDQGYLQAGELETALVHQQGQSPALRFGEVAIGLGFLTRGQVQGLLQIQAENRLRIGEVLVLKSCLTEQELIRELKAYREFLAGEDRKSA